MNIGLLIVWGILSIATVLLAVFCFYIAKRKLFKLTPPNLVILFLLILFTLTLLFGFKSVLSPAHHSVSDAKASDGTYVCTVGPGVSYSKIGNSYQQVWTWHFEPPIPNSGGGYAIFQVDSPSGFVYTTLNPDTRANGPYWNYSVAAGASPGYYNFPVTAHVSADWSGDLDCGSVQVIVPAAPNPTISSTPSIANGQNSTVSWNTPNGVGAEQTACTIYYVTPSSQTVTVVTYNSDNPSGSTSVGPLTQNGTYTFYNACWNTYSTPQNTSASSTTFVSAPAPTVDLKCKSNTNGGGRGSAQDGPCALSDGLAGTLTWTSTNATSCSIDQGIGSVGTSGTTSTGALYYSGGASRVYTISCSGSGGSSSDSITYNIIPPAPTVDLTCTDQNGGSHLQSCSIPYGTTGYVYYNTTYADECFVSGPYNDEWTPPSGGPISTGVLYANVTYNLLCNGGGGSGSDSVTFTVSPPPSPTADLNCKVGSFPLQACDAYSGQSLRLVWSTSNINSGSCVLYKDGAYYASVPDFYNGNSYTSGALYATTTFTLTCSSPGAPYSVSDSVTLTVPTIDIQCNSSQGPCSVPSGGGATLSWSSSACATISIDNGFGNVSTPSGSSYTGGLYSNTTYTATCTNSGGYVVIQDSVTVNIAPDWSLNCTQASITVVQGNTGSYSLSTTPLNGFSYPVNFTGPSYSPNPGSPPGVSFSNNNAYPSATTTALITTTTSTSVGTYNLTFTGTGNSISHGCTVQLVVQAAPLSVDIQCNSTQGPCNIPYNSSATISWTSANCTSRSIDQGWGSVGASGTGETPNLFSSKTYTITCNGAAGTVTDSVTVNVGSEWSLSCTPATVTIQQGNSTSYSFNTTALNGFSYPVTFSGPTYSPTPGVAPGTSFSNNNAYPPQTTYGLITTTTSTSVGTYNLTYTGVGNGLSHSCTVQLIITAAPLSVDIQCNSTQGPCTIPYNSSATLSWTSANCINSLSIDQGIGSVAASGSASTGTLTSSKTYTITCSGTAGTVTDSVTINVGTDWSLSCTQASITLQQGNTGSYSLSTTPLNGFSETIAFGLTGISPTPSVSPGVSFSNNNAYPAATTSAIITTTTSTSVGTYNVTFRGNSSIQAISHACTVQLIITAAPLSVDIKCNGADSCSVAYGSTAGLSWTSANCIYSLSINQGIGNVAASGSTTVGPLYATTTYTITCSGAAGTITDFVTVTVSSDWSLSCTQASITVQQGNTGSYSLSTTPLNGFSYPVAFTGPSYSPTPGSAPGVSFSNNNAYPYATTSAIITTTTSTSVGTYNLTFTGTGNGISHGCTVQLIVSAAPLAVDIQCNSTQGPCNVAYNGSATLSWTSANCINSLSIDQGIGSVGASGSISTGSLTTTKTYTITCSGTAGTITDSVTVSVGSDWSLSCTQASITVQQGNTGSYSLTTGSLNGFASPVTFSGPSYSPTPGVAPGVSFSNNGQVPAATTTPIITTTTSTSVGTYNLTFTGTGNSITHTCTVQLTVTAAPLSVDIQCNSTQGPCSVAYNGSATLSWTSANCINALSIDQGIGAVAASGSISTGALTSSKTYTITCSGTAGTIYDSVTVGVGSDWALSCTQASISIQQGNTGSYSLSTTPLGGFASTVAFTGPSYSPTPGTAPGVSFSNNNAVPAAITSAIITTTTSTSTGTYNLTFTGTGNSISHGCTVQLIVTAAPLAVDIMCNSAQSCSIPYNTSATLSWTSSNCISALSIDHGIGSVAASGSTSTGALTSNQTYVITCSGAAGTITDSVTVTVGSDWSLSCNQPSITVQQGNTGSYSLSTTPYNGFPYSINFTGPSYSPTPGTAPGVSFSGNNQIPANTTNAIITTNASTSTGTYNLTFTGTGNSISHGCTVQLIVSAAPLAVDIQCNSTQGPCNVAYNGSATLSWTSTNCVNSLSIDQGIGAVAASGSTSTGALTTSKTYTITCSGAAGTITDTVTVTVGSDWSLSCSQPSVSIVQGNTGSYSLSTTPLNGFASAVAFSGPSYSPTPGTAPGVSFTNNNVVPAATTNAIITTTTSTSVGTYNLTFTGVGNSISHGCVVQLVVTAAPLSVDIQCNSAQSCSIPYNTAATLSWTSANCLSSLSIDHGIGAVAASGSTSTGSLTSTQTYIITCSGAAGTITDSVVVSVGTDWSLSCTQASITLVQGDTGNYSLSTTPLGGFASAVAFSGPSYSPTPGTAPGVSFSNNNAVPAATTSAIITTTPATSAGTYNLTFTGVGNSLSHNCVVQLVVQAAAPITPNAPIITSTDNSTCGAIIIRWSPGATPPTLTNFTVYHSSTSSSGPWTDISGLLSSFSFSGSFTYTHDGSNIVEIPTASNYYKVRAWNGAAFADSLSSSVVGVVACAPSLAHSDKDINKVVGGVSKTFTPIPCSGTSENASLTNNALYSIGDIVTFQINVCNAGTIGLTGVSVSDVLYNMTNPSTATASPGGCITSQSYDSASRTITFNLANIAASSGPDQVCSITFTAVLTQPSSSSPTAVYRFQNTAKIYANQITADPTTYPLGYYLVSTPPYLFGNPGSEPNRQEAAP